MNGSKEGQVIDRTTCKQELSSRNSPNKPQSTIYRGLPISDQQMTIYVRYESAHTSTSRFSVAVVKGVFGFWAKHGVSILIYPPCHRPVLRNWQNHDAISISRTKSNDAVYLEYSHFIIAEGDLSADVELKDLVLDALFFLAQGRQ